MTILVAAAMIARAPTAYPLAINAHSTPTAITALLDAVEDSAALMVVADSDLERELARRIVTARGGPTTIVRRAELSAAALATEPEVLVAPECLSVPRPSLQVASGSYSSPPGILNPMRADWEAITERGRAAPDPDYFRWTVLRPTAFRSDVPQDPALPTEVVLLPADPAAASGGGEGLVHHLGTRGADPARPLSRFRNPVALGLICLDVSSTAFGAADGITDRSGFDGLRGDGGGVGLWHSEDDAEAFVTLALGPKRTFVLDMLAIRQREDDEVGLLRSFVVEARVAGGWLPLGRHEHAGGRGDWARFEIEGAPPAEAFRIRIDGLNSSGTGHLVIDDVELYGVLEAPPAG
jgi:hypothetical protein